MNQQPRHRQEAARSTRVPRALALVTLLAVTAFSLTGFSSASFTSMSANTGTVSAASDWTPPTVTMQSPGTSVRGTQTLTATATDGESGVQSVAIQHQAAEGAGWTTVCTDTTTPFTCSWDTTAVADGAYDLRAVATDRAGYSTTSDTTRTIVANKFTVVLTDPGDVVKGNVTLTTTIYNAGLTISGSSVQYAVAGSGNWKTACTNVLSSSCTWSTTGLASGYYDLRSVANVLLGGTYYSAVKTDVLVDNTAPTVSMTDPGTPLNGTRTFAATASDADSGVAQVVLQYATSGSTTFKTLCTVTDAPYSCRFDTTALANGTYTFRAVATDVAGTSTTSTTVTNRVVDNSASSVSVEDPGTYLTGTVTVAATANAPSGITSVRIQRSPAGTSTWTDLCTDTSSPYTCSWDTKTVADGSYDLRALLLDGAGKTTASAVVSGRLVDNSVVRGVDVQTSNGGGTAGKVDNGDKLTLTYSEQLSAGTVLTGWDGSATAVSFRLRDGNSLGLGSSGDTVDVLKGSTAVNLGAVVLNKDFVKTNKTATFTATMTASTTTVAGVTRTVVTIQLGALASGSGLKTVSSAGTMKWTPSASATDLSGNKCSTAPATETGTADRDF